MHGGILVFAFMLFFSISINDVAGMLPGTGSSWELLIALFMFVSYLVGIFIDTMADCLDSCVFFKFYKWKGCWLINKLFSGHLALPSFYLLNPDYSNPRGKPKNKTENSKLTLAHYKIVRNILNDDAKNNGEEIERDLWEEPQHAVRLFQYAKNRAFAYGSEYQLERIEAYFRLGVFYRNLMVTSFIIGMFVGMSSAVIIGMSVSPCFFGTLTKFFPFISDNLYWLINKFTPNHLCMSLFMSYVCLALVPVFYWASYKFRGYYCRQILGAVYSPPKETGWRRLFVSKNDRGLFYINEEPVEKN